jgi:hypothetical protein
VANFCLLQLCHPRNARQELHQKLHQGLQNVGDSHWRGTQTHLLSSNVYSTWHVLWAFGFEKWQEVQSKRMWDLSLGIALVDMKIARSWAVRTAQRGQTFPQCQGDAVEEASIPSQLWALEQLVMGGTPVSTTHQLVMLCHVMSFYGCRCFIFWNLVHLNRAEQL